MKYNNDRSLIEGTNWVQIKLIDLTNNRIMYIDILMTHILIITFTAIYPMLD